MYLKNNFFKVIIVVMLIANTINSFAQRTLYIDNTQTNTANDGLTEATAFPNFFRAVNAAIPGDTFLVKNGVGPYSNSPSGNPTLNMIVSGTAALPITFKNYPGHTPVIQIHSGQYQGIYIKGSYITIDGLTIRGLNATQTLTQALAQGGSCANPSGALEARYNANGIQVDGRGLAIANKYHHIAIKNCTIYECGGSGIQILQADYITIENNKCYNNAWYSIYAPSGISIYQSYNSDSSTATKMIVRNNICYGNRMYVPWPAHSCQFTDGNGIIIDDTKNGQNGSTLGTYNGRTLVANNIVYNNGGSGIHSFASEHVDIVNNTAYLNSQTPEINNGEIFPQNSNDVKIFNNILVAASDQRINSNYSGNGTNYYNYNLHFGGNSTALTGANTIVGDPKFTNPATADFTLQASSPAINSGIGTFNGVSAPATDFINGMRPAGSGFDMGAYEFGASLGLKSNIEKTIFSLYPNPTKNKVSINVEANYGDKIQVELVNMLGQNVLSNSYNADQQGPNVIAIDPPSRAGVYGVIVTIGNASTTRLLIVE
jgi:Right handed beta helix region/Secretion system C-terminal sorting domain